ncbi:uncharacterized protein LOC120329716 [Styela clava]
MPSTAFTASVNVTQYPDVLTPNDTFNYELEWLICAGLSAPLGLFSLYVAIMQVAYCVLKSGMTKKSAGKRRSSNTGSNSHSCKANVKDRHAFILNTMCAIGAICAFLRAGVDFRLIFGNNTDLGCDLSIKFKLAAYALSLMAVYLVLWLRQRTFYQHPRLKHLSSKLVRVISWTMCILIVTGTVSTAILFFSVGRYVGVPDGCVVKKSEVTSIRWIILIGCTTFFQICLLTLFVYPLVKHNMSVRSGSTCGNNKNNPIIPLIRRATITSAICVTTDIAFALIILILNREIVTMSTFIYDVNIVINTMLIIFSFPDWKIRLMPWRVNSNEEQPTELSTDATSRTRISETNVISANSIA